MRHRLLTISCYALSIVTMDRWNWFDYTDPNSGKSRLWLGRQKRPRT